MTYPSTRTSDNYTPAVALWPDGRAVRCTVQAIRLDSVAVAREKLLLGKVAWVRAEDAERVRGAGDGEYIPCG